MDRGARSVMLPGRTLVPPERGRPRLLSLCARRPLARAPGPAPVKQLDAGERLMLIDNQWALTRGKADT